MRQVWTCIFERSPEKNQEFSWQSNSEHSWYCSNALNHGHWATGPTAEEQKQVCWSSTAWSPVAWPDCRGMALVHWFCKNVCAKSRRGASLLGIQNSGRVCSHSKLTPVCLESGVFSIWMALVVCAQSRSTSSSKKVSNCKWSLSGCAW